MIPVWIAVGTFIVAVWAASATQLVQSYRLAIETARTRSDLPGYLVSEWIVESFHNVEILLRESLAGVDPSALSPEKRTQEEDRTIKTRIRIRSEDMSKKRELLLLFVAASGPLYL